MLPGAGIQGLAFRGRHSGVNIQRFFQGCIQAVRERERGRGGEGVVRGERGG